MRRIRGHDTVPEILIRKAVHRRGIRYRVNLKGLPGRPDIVLPKWRTVIFVHGCFWHRHKGCPVATNPKSNAKFWIEKFASNVKRDRRNARRLRALGWRVLTVWECQATAKSRLETTADRLVRNIRRNNASSKALYVPKERRRGAST